MRKDTDHNAPPKVPGWVLGLFGFLIVASWLPLALIARSRTIKSERPPIHMFLDMDFQPRYGPQDYQDESLAVRFSDGRAMRPPVVGAVRHDLALDGADLNDDHYFRGYETDGNLKPVTVEAAPPQGQAPSQANPAPATGAAPQLKKYIPGYPKNLVIDQAFIKRGQERYNIYCSVCHGQAGYGDGPVHQRISERMAHDPTSVVGWVQPRNLHMPNIAAQSPSQIFDTASNGFNNMRGYAAQIPVQDRWAIVAYVKALQLSQQFPVAELTDDLKAQVDKAPVVQRPDLVQPAAAAPTVSLKESELDDPKLIAKGKELFMTKICFTCHQTDPNVPAPAGLALNAPKFMGAFWGKEHEVHDGVKTDGSMGPVIKIKMDAPYFFESVRTPNAKVVKGAIPAMVPLPTTDDEIKALMAYVKSLSK